MSPETYTGNAIVDPGAAEILLAVMIPTEHLVWAGRPKQGLLLRTTDIYMIPWIGGSACLFWILFQKDLISGRFPLVLQWFILAFFGFALYGLVGRFGMDAWQRARTYYGVTEFRILIVTGLFSHRVTSFTIRDLPELEYTDGAGGFGTIKIGSAIWDFIYMGNVMPDSGGFSPRLDLVPEGKRIYELIRLQQGRIQKG